MKYDGGCLCGNTRYTIIGDPLRVLYCHCNDCKKQTFNPLVRGSSPRPSTINQ